MPSRGWLGVIIAGIGGLGNLIVSGGIELSSYENDRLALVLVMVGGVLIIVAAILTAGLLLGRGRGSDEPANVEVKADHGSIAQAAGRDAINVGNIVQSPAEPSPIYIQHPETNGFLEAGIWWEYERYEPLSLLLGKRVPEVQPFCPDHRSYLLQFQPRSATGGRGNIRPLHRSDWPDIDKARSRGQGYMVCAHGKGHDVRLESGTDNLENAWVRAEAKIAAQIRESKEGEGEAGVFFVGGPDD